MDTLRIATSPPTARAHLLPEAGATQERTLEAVRCSPMLGPEDFVEPFDDLQDFLRCGMGKALPNAFNSERPNLTDFHPRPPGKLWRTEFKSQRKASPLGSTG